MEKNKAEIEHTPDSYSILLAAKHLPLKRSVNGTVYRLCDVVQRFTEKAIDCHGLKRPITVVLIIYARIPQNALKRHQERQRYEQLVRGKWVLNP